MRRKDMARTLPVIHLQKLPETFDRGRGLICHSSISSDFGALHLNQPETEMIIMSLDLHIRLGWFGNAARLHSLEGCCKTCEDTELMRQSEQRQNSNPVPFASSGEPANGATRARATSVSENRSHRAFKASKADMRLVNCTVTLEFWLFHSAAEEFPKRRSMLGRFITSLCETGCNFAEWY
jgi:hypothetical protein